jgi:hypothetical protein
MPDISSGHDARMLISPQYLPDSETRLFHL